MPCLLVLRVLLGEPCLVVQWQWLGRAAGGAARAGCGCVLQRCGYGGGDSGGAGHARGGTAVQQPMVVQVMEPAWQGCAQALVLAAACPVVVQVKEQTGM